MVTRRFFPSRKPFIAMAFAATAMFASGPGMMNHGRVVTRAVPRAVYSRGGAPWFSGGRAWRHPGARFGFYPRLGLHIPFLPLGYMTFWFGGAPYYYYDGIYYSDAPTGGYLVTDPPPEHEDSPMAATPKPGSPDAAALDALLIIPKEGQNAEKMVADRKDARRYALERSGYDPAFSDPTDPGTPRARQAYLRAMRSYLEARGYSVK